MGTISDVVRQFIAKHIDSIDTLEILLLLRQDSRKEWGGLAVARALQLDRTNVETRLKQLSETGLLTWRHVASERVYQYRPSSAELVHGADELTRWYATHPVSVILQIFSTPQDRIRTYPNRADKRENGKM